MLADAAQHHLFMPDRREASRTRAGGLVTRQPIQLSQLSLGRSHCRSRSAVGLEQGSHFPIQITVVGR